MISKVNFKRKFSSLRVALEIKALTEIVYIKYH